MHNLNARGFHVAKVEEAKIPTVEQAAEAHAKASDAFKQGRAALDGVFKTWQALGGPTKRLAWKAYLAMREVSTRLAAEESKAFSIVEAAQNQLGLFEPTPQERAEKDPKQLVNLGLVPEPPASEPARRKSTVSRRIAKPKPEKRASSPDAPPA